MAILAIIGVMEIENQTDAARGLSSAEVSARVAAGEVNINADVRTRTIPRIVRDNICTLFNLVNIILAVAIFWTGSYRNLLFMAIILCNIGIGIFQEVRSKLTIDRLSVISATKAHVIRDGEHKDIALSEIVLGDIVAIGRGDQIPSDCVIIEGKCSINESLLTGESDSKTWSASFTRGRATSFFRAASRVQARALHRSLPWVPIIMRQR